MRMASGDDVIRQFEIQLDPRVGPVFHGGELITGNLKIELKRQITIQAIKLQFKGRACWLSDASKGGEVEKVYFDKDFTLLERPPGRSEPGHFPWIADYVYKLPFECPLPIGCPTSFESPHAFIRYFIRATLIEELGTSTRRHMIKTALSVVSPESAKESASHPVSATETVVFGKCCCKGRLTGEVQLSKSEYAPGEKVTGMLKIDNRVPRQTFDQIEVRLVDRATRVGNAAATVPPLRTLLRRKLDTAESVKSKSSLQRDDILFLQIPAVAPSTAGIAEPMNLEMLSISPNLKSADSNFMRSTPATATLRFRKQAFIRIEYMIQVSLGTELLLELPITILPLPIKGPNIVYEPFAGGPQPIDESDEPVRGVNEESSMFTPLYPVFRSLSTVAATEISTESQPSQETNQVQQSNGESTNLANSDR